jgi:hypothetical protein
MTKTKAEALMLFGGAPFSANDAQASEGEEGGPCIGVTRKRSEYGTRRSTTRPKSSEAEPQVILAVGSETL